MTIENKIDNPITSLDELRNVKPFTRVVMWQAGGVPPVPVVVDRWDGEGRLYGIIETKDGFMGLAFNLADYVSPCNDYLISPRFENGELVDAPSPIMYELHSDFQKYEESRKDEDILYQEGYNALYRALESLVKDREL